MNILNEINSAAKQAVSTLYGQDVPEKMVQLQKTKKEFEGSLTLVCSHSSRFQRRSQRIQHRR